MPGVVDLLAKIPYNERVTIFNDTTPRSNS